MLAATDFVNLLTGLVESLPQHKALSERGVLFAWASFPEEAKQQLTPGHLAYAATQRVLDPEPRNQVAIHIQLLAYLYPLRNGAPDLARGFRMDLEQRMAAPGRFHPLTAAAEHQRVLLPGEPQTPFTPQETAEQLRRRLNRIASQTGVVL